MTEIPDPHWKLYPELDEDNQPYETLEEKEEREFEIYLDSKDDENLDRLR